MGKLRLFSILAMLVWGISACQPVPERRANQDPIENANRLIDQGRYDQAIDDLERLQATEGSSKLRVVLASAYAARGGLMVEKHWGFLMGFQAPRTPEFKAYGVTATSKSLQELYKIAVNIEMWAERIESLPVVEGGARNDIERAIAILQNETDRGARLYRALLGFVIVKSDLGDIQISWSKAEKYFREIDVANLKSIKNFAQLCRQDVQNFANDAGVITLRLQSIVEDLMVSYPSKQAELKHALDQIRGVTQPLLTAGRGVCKF